MTQWIKRRSDFDTVIVGGGSAGCVLAARLSDDPGRRVLLLEAGPDYGPLAANRWPVELLNELEMPFDSHSWGFDEIDAARAKVIGGCSAHNASLVVWSAPGDHERWTALGNDGWSFSAQEPHIERAEATIGAHQDAVGASSWFVEPFTRACESIGYPVLGDANSPEWVNGVGMFRRNVVDGVRRNTAFAYLDPVRDRSNLTIRGDTLVERVLLDRGQAVGVVVHDREGQHRIEAGSIVISAGAYLSPAILQRSGIGPPQHLQAIEVAVEVPLEGVGSDLHDHAGVVMTFDLGAGAPAAVNRLPELSLRAASSLVGDRYWDTQVLIGHGADDDDPSRSSLWFRVSALDSDSVGSVRVASTDPTTLPVLDQPWRHLTGHDRRVLEEGLQLVRQIGASAALQPFIGPETMPGQQPDLGAWVTAHAEGYWHPTGTCRMGPADDPGAVVDARGRVHGTRGLRVVDASIFPTGPRANTNLPTIAAAEFLATSFGGPDD